MMGYDVFISYASEDEEAFVSSLIELLNKLAVKVWFGPDMLKVGDSLSRSIDKGLTNARFNL
jgi:TIR domain